MGRRGATARFMPGRYVFPGGVIEPDDRHTPIQQPLNARCMNYLQGMAPEIAAALPVCALREAFEETGIAFTLPQASAEDDWLHSVADGGGLDLSGLSYLGRAITPPAQKLRFHARFFLLLLDHAIDPAPLSDELEDVRWLPLPVDPELPMAPVTEFMLQECARLAHQGFPLDAPPFWFRWEDGERRVSYE